jgi:hypothetical protein
VTPALQTGSAVQLLIQRKANAAGHQAVHPAAERGIAGSSTPLPFSDSIQPAFGHYDVSGIQAHTDSAAAEGARAMGAQAFATGNHVAFAGTPDLHTAAHEAAHVVQQRGGVQLKDGVGEVGDQYEQQADQVADAVVGGRSAEPILNAMSEGGGGDAPALQRKPANDLAWRNAVIEGENRIQDVIRAAQRDKKARVQLELVIEPDFVGVDGHTASGAAPAGKDPDGVSVHNAAQAALRSIVDQPPRSRRTMTVALDRVPDGWERSRFALTGETKSVADTPAVSAANGQAEITNILQLAQAAGHGEATIDVACTPDGVRILSWRSSGAAVAGAVQPSTEHAARWLVELASHAGGRTLVYELRHKIGAIGWEPEGMKLLGEVKPPEAEGGEGDEGAHITDPNDAEEIVADIKNKRRMVLSLAGELIAEQDPSRLHNLIFSLGPLLLVGMLRVGKVVRIGRLWKARAITEAVCENGCEAVARQITRHIGGKIVRIEPKAKTIRFLGAFREKNWAWGYHEVVVKDGRVYDLTTGHQGLSIAEYKQLWRDADAINFGF